MPVKKEQLDSVLGNKLSPFHMLGNPCSTHPCPNLSSGDLNASIKEFVVFLIVLLPYALVWKKKCYRKFVLAGCGGGRRECSVWEDKVFLDANDSPGLFYVIYQ